MIKKIFDKEYIYIIVSLLIIIFGIIFYDIFEKILGFWQMVVACTGVTLLSLKKQFKNKNIFKLLKVIIASIIFVYIAGLLGITYVSTEEEPIVASISETNIIMQEETKEIDVNTEEDFYPVMPPERLDMDLKSDTSKIIL